MTHTPGPWFVGEWTGQCHMDHVHGHGKCKYDYSLVTHGEWARCVAAGDADNPIALVGWNDYGSILSTDDARLIAAAPALLEALKLCIATMTDNGSSEPIPYLTAIERARAAIAQAKGGEGDGGA